MANYPEFQSRMIAQGRVDFDHQQGFQCVDLDREWWYENGVINTGGNPTAISYWTNPPASLLAACDRLETSAAEAGDTVILRTNGAAPGDFSGDGHIGVATGGLSDTQVEILEQHGAGGGNDGLGGNAIRTRWVPRSRVAGIYRFKTHVATAITPTVPPAASVPSGKYVYLPASVASWTAYHVGSSLRKGTSDVAGTLAPAEFGGLRYEILGWISDKAVVINTDSFGQVAIWVKGTDAQFQDEAPAPPPVDWKSVYKFERFDNPLNVATNKNTNVWNLQFQGGFANATAIAPLEADHAFIAVGKATKQDFDEHPVYYLSNESFGSADTTGEPAFWQGVNSVDLKPAPSAPTSEVATPVSVPAEVPATSVTEASPPVEDTAEKIEVKVNPSPNPESWKTSFKTNEAGDYTALVSVTVHDLDGKLPDLELPEKATVKIAGKFIKDGKEYWRTEKSASRVDSKLVPKEEDWRGIPVTTEDGGPVLEEDLSFLGYIDSKLDSFEESLHHDGASIRKKIIAAGGSAHGEIESLAARFNIKRRK